MYSEDGTYTLNTATQYQVGDLVVAGPITWRYVGPATFIDPTEPPPPGDTGAPEPPDTGETIPAAPEELPAHEFLLGMTMWDADGHLFEADSVEQQGVISAVNTYDLAHPTDAEANQVLVDWEFETTLEEGSIFRELGYKIWEHRFAQHSNIFAYTGYWDDGAWWSRIDTTADIVAQETNAVVVKDFCSGVLIEDDIVLTARHCVANKTNTQQFPDRKWCTRGNLDGLEPACAKSENTIINTEDNGIWSFKTDWAVVKLEHPPETESGEQTHYTTMVLSQWDDQGDTRFHPELLGSAMLAGPLNDCRADGTDAFYNAFCDNFRFEKGQAGPEGRPLLHRKSGDVELQHQYQQSVSYDTMFGSGDSGGPIFWEGLVPGGDRFVVALVSGAMISTGGISLRGPRVAAWREEIIAALAAVEAL